MEIYYPTLDLFAFHQPDLAPGKSSKSIINQYWEELPNRLKNLHPFVNFVEKPPSNPLKFIDPYYNTEINGLYCRWLLDNMYGFLLNSSITSKDDPQLPKAWVELKKRILPPPINELTIGKTWMISGLVLEASATEKENLAKKAYHYIVDQEWQHQRQGEFFGGTLWEVWRGSLGSDVPEAGSHALIIFYSDKAAMRLGGKFYENWLDLLLSRHQIWHNYRVSRQVKLAIQSNFDQAIKALETSQITDHKQLKQAWDNHLKSLSIYGKQLQAISQNVNGIESHLIRYDNHLQQISVKAEELTQDLINFVGPQVPSENCLTNLECLAKFSNLVAPKYLDPITQDYTYFAAGLTILNNLTAVLQGMENEAKTNQDQDFQNFMTVGITGFALAFLSACVIAPHALLLQDIPLVKTYTNFWQLSDQQLQLVLGLNCSIIVGAISSLFIKIYLDIKQYYFK